MKNRMKVAVALLVAIAALLGASWGTGAPPAPTVTASAGATL